MGGGGGGGRGDDVSMRDAPCRPHTFCFFVLLVGERPESIVFILVGTDYARE